MEIEKHKEYELHKDRTAEISAWLDLTLGDVSDNILEVLKEETIERKDKHLVSIFNYINGILDGNRFGKKNPYENGCKRLEGTRIIK